MAGDRGRRAGTHRRGVLYRPLCVILILAAILLGTGIFFRTLHIEVEGASIYSAEEIIDASGVETGKNLFLINKKEAVQRIEESLPYIRSVTIRRRLPSTLEIQVEESPALAYIPEGNSCWLLDQDGKVLEQVQGTAVDGLIWVKGLSPTALAVGETVQAAEEDSENLTYLVAVLQALEARASTSRVSAIDVSNSANLRFYYDDRFTVALGQNEDLESKLELLDELVAEKSSTEKGSITFLSGGEARYIPNP